ncbi:3-dehydroquinate synthase [Gallaecimonas sp. GXIMD4217]|uniref:3-dehydroquinate synthase n=1 Tax=Gallaecimonas sp. GXIMD4217 TaxID=3131927 RepID=UPI00311B0994
MEQIDVGLGRRQYPIFIANQIAPALSALVHGRQLMVVTQEAIAAAHLPDLLPHLASAAGLHRYLLPDGEVAKSLVQLEKLTTAMIEAGLGRDALILAFGGGVVGDLAGFAAACFHRGIDFIQLPTTLLAQVDSAVGGKTAVNHSLGKNLIGAFHQPKAVFVNVKWLDTLPARELSAGLAEVIKYGVIADAEFFRWLEEHAEQLMARDERALIHAIKRSLAVKAEVVAQDEQERGVRALLNLGHTFGHAIEAHQGFGQWLHGEAVAAGTMMAAELAFSRGMLKDEERQRLLSLLEACGLPVKGPDEMAPEAYLPLMMRDKKVLSGKLRLVLPRGLGRAEVIDDASGQEILAAIGATQQR